jgi:hypothetical protein
MGKVLPRQIRVTIINHRSSKSKSNEFKKKTQSNKIIPEIDDQPTKSFEEDVAENNNETDFKQAFNSNSNYILILVPKSKQMSRKSAPSSKKEQKNQPKIKEMRTWDDKFAEVNDKNVERVDQYYYLIKLKKN